MAAFFDQCSAGIMIEAVPISNFWQKRKAMLAYGEHFNPAGDLLGLLNQRRNRRHIAIFHRNPNRGGVRLGEGRSLRQIGRICEERLFAEDRQGPQGRDLLKLCHMAVIGADNDQAI